MLLSKGERDERYSQTAEQQLWERADQKRREELRVLLFNQERESLERELEASCKIARASKSLPRFIVLAFGQYIVGKVRSFLDVFS